MDTQPEMQPDAQAPRPVADGDADVQRPVPADAGGVFGGRGRVSADTGYILAMVGLLIIPLIAMTAFAVDVGAWYAQGQRMQRAADSAALAGVVWASDPIDLNKWNTVAREAATRNGYTNGVGGVTVNVEKINRAQIRVTISQDGRQYFSRLLLSGQRLTRSATAQFVEPVPLGSPRNYFGTGGLGTSTNSTSVYAPERLWAAVSGQCTDKVQGDRIAARYANGTNDNGCTGTLNTEYRTTNYEYYIDLPLTRSYATDVIVYHGNFMTRDNGSCGAGYLPAPQPNEFCPGGLASQPAMSTTFTLYQSDSTPLDDSDNPTMASVGGCVSGTGTGTRTFGPRRVSDGLESNFTFNPSSQFQNVTGWVRLCRIPSSAPGGKYILRVRNQATTSGTATNNNGSNAFSLVATPASPQRLCDARTDATCPRVYAKDYMSVYALADGAANFFLAEIGREHAGKKVQIQLWDAAEGAQELRIQRPTGTNTWTEQAFNWSSTCAGCSGTNVTAINVAGFDFNNRLITIEIQLPVTYNPPTDNAWWRIYYRYGSNATDRTTWSVNILGDPVHLVE